MDISGSQKPIAITLTYVNEDGKIKTLFKLIDYKLLIKNHEEAIKELFQNFFDSMEFYVLGNITIFTHNLGSLDGYYILPGLLQNYRSQDRTQTSALIDQHQKFISITTKIYGSKWTFIDSYRIFPVSLKELTNLFNSSVEEQKYSSYNKDFNNLTLFKNFPLLRTFIRYTRRDSYSLFLALFHAQKIYFKQYNVDITSIVSTSTLSLKIYRSNFQKLDIPILRHNVDKLIRTSYIGGSTDYYYKHGKNLKYYDVNSLYPAAMLKPLPVKYIKSHDATNWKLVDMFGFCEAIITTPKDINIPLLPFKQEGRTIHPEGTWQGIYFTEELKPLIYHEFTKEYLFQDYIDHFYENKKTSKGALRWISKMHLNSLYGYFGRSLELLNTVNIDPKDLIDYISKYPVHNMIKIDTNNMVLLISDNLNYNVINTIKSNTLANYIISNKKFSFVKSNVAIASAIIKIFNKDKFHSPYQNWTDTIYLKGRCTTFILKDLCIFIIKI